MITPKPPCPDCPCPPPSSGCDYTDDFAYLRDYEISLVAGDFENPSEMPHFTAREPAEPIYAVDLSGSAAEIHQAVGGGGWYTSQLRAQPHLEACVYRCQAEQGGYISYDPPHAWWRISVANQGSSRLFCRKSPIANYGPAGIVGYCPENEGTHPVPDGIRRSFGVGWAYWDCGHLLRDYTANDANNPVVSISAILHNDQTYATSHWSGLQNMSFYPNCYDVDSGGYWEWGLHLGEPTYGAATTPGDTGTYNVVRLCIDRSAEVYGSDTGTAYLRIWDDDGEFSEVSLGVVTTSLSTAQFARLTFTRTSAHFWTIVAELGGQTHTATGVKLNLDDGTNAPVLKLGVYCLDTTFNFDPLNRHGGGEWSALCVHGVETPDDGCYACVTPTWGESWLIDTAIYSSFYSSSDADCNTFDGDPWGGPQVLGPTMEECEWRTCHNIYAKNLSAGGCILLNDSPAAKITLDVVNSELVLEFYKYEFSGAGFGSINQIVLARYTAPTSQACGPATFTKTSDNTTGEWFPLTITAERVFSRHNCAEDSFNYPECCDVFYTKTVDQFSGQHSWVLPDADVTFTDEVTYANWTLEAFTIGRVRVTPPYNPYPGCAQGMEFGYTLVCRVRRNMDGTLAGLTWLLGVQNDGVGGWTWHEADNYSCDPLSIEFLAIPVDMPGTCHVIYYDFIYT